MALNPAFASQSTRRLPLSFGYVQGVGDRVVSTETIDGTLYSLYILGEGEWDGFSMMALDTDSHLTDGNILGEEPNPPYSVGILNYVHFHSGAYTIKGAGNQLVSQGPDQQYDEWFSGVPTVTPPQSFSGIAYAIFSAAITDLGPRDTIVGTPMPIAPTGIWRSTRCRTFDAYGNVTGYGFTTNPAWHFVESILRYKIKPQQPGLAGLTDAEKACFDWSSIAETAARNDFILPNGNPRFAGSYIFASDASLTNILETILRVSRCFQRIYGSKIYLIGDDPRPSVFLMGLNHVIPGSLKLAKKDISKSPNVFIPKYRDIDIPAVCSVQTVAPGVLAGGVPLATRTFNLSGTSPFLAGDIATYGGSSDPTFDGNYLVQEPEIPVGASTGYVPNQVLVGANQTGIWLTAASDGYLGTNDARFSERAPTNVQHRSAQRMVATQAPGLAVQPRIASVTYDCGNSTFDQTNRLMKFERDRTLGTDIGAGWTAPSTVSISARMEAVDVNNQPLAAIETHDVITLDDWVTPEFTGDYEVVTKKITGASDDSEGQLDLELLAYNRNAPTDVSDDPGQSYATVPNSDLPFGTFPLTTPGWVLQASPLGKIDPTSGLLTVTTSDLSIQWQGKTSPTAYPAASWSGLTPGGTYVLFLNDPTGDGTNVTYGSQIGFPPLASNPAGTIVVLYGIFNANSFASIDLETGSAALFSGSGTDQTTFNLPSTAAADSSNILDWVSPQGFVDAGQHLHYIGLCETDASRLMQLVYNSSVGVTWGGPLNFMGLTWNDAASVTQSSSGVMQFVELTLAGGEEVCFGAGIIPASGLIPIPTGYSLAQSILMAFPYIGIDSGNPAHGMRAYVDTTGHAHHDYSDGSGNNWQGTTTVLVFAWKNNKGTVSSSGGWTIIPLSTGRKFAAGGFSILDQRAGAPPTNFPADNLTHVTAVSGTAAGKLPLPSGLSSTTLQVIPCPNSFQITGNDMHGVNQCLVDADLNVKTSFMDGEGNVWYGSSAVFALIVDTPTS